LGRMVSLVLLSLLDWFADFLERQGVEHREEK